jgi:polysaccharide pyruvyl transferase WcaK-like protein
MTHMAHGRKAAADLGIAPVKWRSLGYKLRSRLLPFDAIVFIGADVMDGSFGDEWSCGFWTLADQLARDGCRVAILGFSFNESPPQSVLAKISAVSRRVKIHLRDPVSFRRFERHFPQRASLTSDVAFLLEPRQPQNEPEEIFKWVQTRKAAGDAVVGINLHHHLLKDTPGLTIDQLMKAAVQAMLNIALAQPCSFLLIPHDTRPGSNDEEFLRQMADELTPRLGVRIAVAPGELHADEIKALVGFVDVVLTGRMHLAIAALAQSVPIGVITYNGKFEGLVEHFHLPDWLLVTPAQAASAAVVQDILLRLLAERNGLADQIKSRLPAVLQLSKTNFTGFSEP